MSLIDRFLPDYQFVERHAILIKATPAAVLDVVAAYDPLSDPLFRFLINLREAPARAAGWLLRRQTIRPAPFGLNDFLFLGREGDREIAFGLAGRFWRGDYGLIQVTDPSAFEAFDQPGILRLVLNFKVQEHGQGSLRLATETRVYGPDPGSRSRFTPYWLIIRPVSGFIRRRTLQSVKRLAERGAGSQ